MFLFSIYKHVLNNTKAFNARTEAIKAETPVPVVLTAFNDRTFTFVTKVGAKLNSSLLKLIFGIRHHLPVGS